MAGLKVLVTGASGLLGHKIVKLALERGYEVCAIYREHEIKLGIPIRLDLTNYGEVMESFSKQMPDAVIHTAAFTDVDGCEANRELAWNANAVATRNVAVASAKVSAHITYISTDYVFDGERGNYSEEDRLNPINYYGYTKLKGEEFLRENSDNWCIARTSVVYGWSFTDKQNFATWLINDLNQGKEVKALTDQYVSPTFNTNLAQMLLEIAERKIMGVLHVAGASRLSRYEFALKLADVFDLNKRLIKPARMEEMRWKAKRPRDSSLKVTKASFLLNSKPMKVDEALGAMKGEKRAKS